MSLALIPDVEPLLAAFFRDQAEVEDIVGTRVYSELPETKEWPAVRLQRITGAPAIRKPLHLDAPLVQVDAFAGPRATARELAETCRAVIDTRLAGTHSEWDAVVTGVDFGELRGPFLDDDFTPKVHHCLFLVTIYLHPSRLSGGS